MCSPKSSNERRDNGWVGFYHSPAARGSTTAGFGAMATNTFWSIHSAENVSGGGRYREVRGDSSPGQFVSISMDVNKDVW